MADFNHDNVLESNQGGRKFFLNGYSYIKKNYCHISVLELQWEGKVEMHWNTENISGPWDASGKSALIA